MDVHGNFTLLVSSILLDKFLEPKSFLKLLNFAKVEDLIKLSLFVSIL